MITIAPGTDPELTSALSLPTLTQFLRRARVAVALKGTVDVLLTTDAELKRLNRTFRHKNRPTDILSFPAAQNPLPGPAARSRLPPSPHHAGDLAISLETATRQAAHFNHPLATELRILLLHGLLHLHGLDHETDSGDMGTRESQLRTRFRLPNSLISRTGSPPKRRGPR